MCRPYLLLRVCGGDGGIALDSHDKVAGEPVLPSRPS